ncbi:hypothetical protein C2S51_007913 [Perilla frutescens var. frutescens]|nr:hypothetical protein C2S51_007913 [Perilla frutescens var. frutescens]
MESWDGENDPEYEHFLSKLKEHNKSYLVEAESDGVPHLIKYEPADYESNEQCGVVHNWSVTVQNVNSNRETPGGIQHQRPYDDNEKGELIGIDEEQFYMNRTNLRMNDQVEDNQDNESLIQIDREHFYLKPSGMSNDERRLKKMVRYDANGDHGDIRKRAIVQIDGNQLCGLLSLDRNKVKIEENENPDLSVSRVEWMKVEPLDKITVFGDYDHVKNEHAADHYLERDEIHSLTTTPWYCAKCSLKFKHQEFGESDDHSDLVSEDVEILDIAKFAEKGIMCPFVSSKKFHRSMVEDDFPEAVDVASDEFRKEVLMVLEKPFDKEEYTKYRKDIKLGSYLDYHSDLKRKLKKYRYRRGKCLVVLRGFFFWLENLTREGSFQPWTDQECLAVEPPPAS